MKNISFRNDILPLKDVLYRLALRITLRHEDAEDVVQDTLIKVWNRRDNWQEINDIEAFALTICRNLSLDKIKKANNSEASLDDQSVFLTDRSSNPYERMIQQDRLDWVRRLVNNLPEKQRSCIQLRDFEGKSYKEIAEILKISEEQVKVNIFRARQNIKQKFQEAEKYGL
jgi:RNA polymerase sigma-70 factor (ECF subfamily)